MENDLKKEVEEIKQCFRILSDWKITVDTKGKLFDQCSFDVEKKKAIVYEKKSDIPDKIYVFHEILHIVLMATFRDVEGLTKKQRIAREEELVMDLTAFLFMNIFSGKNN